MSGGLLALFGFVLCAAASWQWYRRMQEVSIPRALVGFQVAFALSFALAVAALVNDPGALGGTASLLVVLASSLFLILNFTGYQNRNEPAVRVGERILDFTAPDADGTPFELSSLEGQSFLLKFFRGHW